MPELLKLKDLGNFGVITDLSNDSLPPEVFTSGMNFRLRNGKLETYNGAKSLGYIPVNLYARKIILWIRSGGDKLVIMGNEGVYTFDGVTWIDVTPVDFVTITNLNEWSWSACQSGISIVINNPQIGPYYLNDGVSVATPLPYDATRSWQDISHSPLIIRSHKEFLIALGNKAFVDGAIDHNQIGWSAPATETGIPFTWDPTDISTIAGSLWLSGQGGYIIDGLTLRDEFCIYSKNSIDFMRYVGGDLLWNVRPLSCETGLLALNNVVEVYDRHLLLTKNDILLNDGNSLSSIVDKKVRNRIFDAIDTGTYERSFLAVNELDKEVWVCIPERGQAYPNLAVVYAWERDQVYFRDTVLRCVDGCTGPKSSSMVVWDADTTTWNSNAKKWLTDKTSTFESTLVLLDDIAGLYNALVTVDDVGYNTVLERLNVPLSGYGVSCTTVSIHPHISCPNSVLIRMGASLNPNEGVRWKEAQEFNPATMRKLDMRTTGPFHSWRIESIGNVPFSLSGLDIVYEVNGER